MKEYSIRNKAKQPIITFTSAVLDRFLHANPDAVGLTLSKLVEDYASLTGKRPVVDYDQRVLLERHYGVNEAGTWKSAYSELEPHLFVVKRTFEMGFMTRTLSDGVLADLALAEAFYALLDR